ncbi:MAG: formylglycine-generating enzyme family protein [Planctomycetota bacterium]
MKIFSNTREVTILVVVVLLACSSGSDASEMPSGGKFVNSIGMEFVRIDGGSFSMGSDEGDFDERPVHEVTISRPFYIGRTEVTVEQFRRFRGGYKGKEELEPFACSMSWYDADAFCKWLGVKEGLVYRLPSEAEWEWASRVEGVENMQSGVAEWCFDWHGLYRDGAQVDPVGPKKGWMKVVRGGGLDTFNWDEAYFRRVTNRAAISPRFAPPAKEYLDKMLKWPEGTSETHQASYKRKVRLLGRHTIGFRVVLGEMPKGKPPAFEPPALMRCVKQKGVMLEQGPDANEPYYKIRRLFPYGLDVVKVGWKVGIERGVFEHHHNAALAGLPNGDLLAFYYNRPLNTGEREPILTIAGLRLRRGVGYAEFVA